MGNYNDNGAVYGSQLVTVGTGEAAVSYVAKNIKLGVYSADRKTSTDEMGNETKQWFSSKIPTGTMTLQFPSSTTKAPAQYSIVALVPVGYTSETSTTNVILYELGETYDSGGETLMDVSIAVQQA